MKIFIGILLCVFCFQLSYGQKKKKVTIPNKPIDTLLFRDRQIVLFANGTWQYVPRKMSIDFKVRQTDTIKVFNECWSNSLLFPYNKGAVGGDTVITLVDSIHKFVHPNPNPIIGEYKQRRGHFHGAWDLALLPGTPVKSAFDGKVRIAEFNRGGYGYLVIIRHFNGLETYYSHLSKIEVAPNEIVKAGDIIGLGGNTGRASAFHLHFEIRYHDKTINPHELIDDKTYKLKKDKLVIHRSGKSTLKEPILLENGEIDSLFTNQSLATLATLTPASAVTTVAAYATKKTKEHINKVKAAEEAEKAKYYTVKSGDNLGKIAKKYNITIKQLCKLNGIKETSILQLGKKLKVK